MAVGFQDITLWFSSYLSGLSFLVYLPGSALSLQLLNTRVPQGLILEPVLYLPSSFADLIHFYGFKYHLYADNTHIYFFSLDLSLEIQMI